MEGVVRQFRELLRLLDESAVGAQRGQVNAEQAHKSYLEASRGTADPLMAKAVTKSRTATEKAGKTARLLSEAAEHFATYVNLIAPGTVPPRASAPEAMPTGEQVVQEAMSRRERASRFLDRTVKKSDDLKDAVSKTTEAVTEGTKASLRQIKGEPPPASAGTGPGTSTTGHGTLQPAPTPQVTAHDATAAITVTVLGAAMVGRAAVDYIKKRREKKEPDGDEE